jgi:hypothetical protein
LKVQFVLKRGATTPRKMGTDSAKIMRTLTVFNDLVNIDKYENAADKSDDDYAFLREIQKVNLKK